MIAHSKAYILNLLDAQLQLGYVNEKMVWHFFILIFLAFLEKDEYLGIRLSNLNKIIDSDKTDQ